MEKIEAAAELIGCGYGDGIVEAIENGNFVMANLGIYSGVINGEHFDEVHGTSDPRHYGVSVGHDGWNDDLTLEEDAELLAEAFLHEFLHHELNRVCHNQIDPIVGNCAH